MPNENMNNLLPNGRNKEEFTKECHDFIETYYDQLMGSALKIMWNDVEKAQDLLHDTIEVLLKGGDNIDFTRQPRLYFKLMLKRQHERNFRIRQKGFELYFIIPTWFDSELCLDFQAYPLEEFHSYKKWKEVAREHTNFKDLAEKFPQLLTCLTHVEKTHIEWLLDGLSYEEMQKKHPVSRTRIGQILTRARKKLKKAAEKVLAQDVG